MFKPILHERREVSMRARVSRYRARARGGSEYKVIMLGTRQTLGGARTQEITQKLRFWKIFGAWEIFEIYSKTTPGSDFLGFSGHPEITRKLLQNYSKTTPGLPGSSF